MARINKKLMDKFPSIWHLEKKAKSRIPNVAWVYLQAGTGRGTAAARNRQRWHELSLLPRFVRGRQSQDLTTKLFGTTYQVPFGVAPVGLTGLVWPRAELILAESANRYGYPFSLSTVATQTPEVVGPRVGNMGWFQLYPPKDPKILKDLLQRAQEAGFHTLLITADVPAPGRREASRRTGITLPLRITPSLIWDGLSHPLWTLQTLRTGFPSLPTIAPYSPDPNKAAEYARFDFRGDLDWDYIDSVKQLWDGPVVLKGLLHPEDAKIAVFDAGMDGVVVSNHGGRQFDGTPAAIDALPHIVHALKGSDAKIILDSGITSGLDIIKALALGADFCLLGKAFLYGCAALGDQGGDHVANILIEDLKNNMAQLGVESIDDIKKIPLFR